MSAYSGKTITWDEALNSPESLMPPDADLGTDADAAGGDAWPVDGLGAAVPAPGGGCVRGTWAMPAIGRRVPRREGPEKLTGRAQDPILPTPDPRLSYGVTLRLTIPRGAIRAVTFDPAFSWADFVVVTALDVPHNRVALIADDQPLLADTRVMHQMEPIALVAHRDRDKAYEALNHITVVYGPEVPVLTVDDALAATTRIYGDDNVFKDIRIERGDVDRGLAAADLVIEGEYHLPHQEHAYIENNAIAAWVLSPMARWS